VWHKARQEGKTAVFMYVADGYLEYESSWRLQAIVEAANAELLLGTAD
jgi:hypothetical protein